MKQMTVTTLRSQIYGCLDEIIETGEPIWIMRKNKKIKIALAEDKPKDKFKNLIKHNAIVGDPDDLIDLKIGEWDEEKNL